MHWTINLFTIDIYESDDEYMVEAILENHEVKDIKVRLMIMRYRSSLKSTHKPFQKLFHKDKADTTPTQRKIPFPFSICSRRITAEFTHPTLVIRIS